MVCDSFLSEISSGLIFNECSICDISDGFMKEHCNNSLVFVYLYLHEGYCLVIIKKKMIYYQRFCKVYLPFNLERIQKGIEKLSNFINVSTREIANLTRIVGKDDVSKLDSDDLV